MSIHGLSFAVGRRYDIKWPVREKGGKKKKNCGRGNLLQVNGNESAGGEGGGLLGRGKVESVTEHNATCSGFEKVTKPREGA